MALLHLLYLQVESELHRKHVREAWGDQLTQKNKVWGGSPGVLVLGRTLKRVWRWRCDTCATGAAARKGTVNKAIHLAGVCSVDFLSQKLFLCVRLT